MKRSAAKLSPDGVRLDAAGRDLVADSRRYWTIWGLPTLLLVAAVPAAHPLRTWLWGIALLGKGAACLVNARRCGRRHCHYTGPFYLLMAAVGVLHGYGILLPDYSLWLWLYLSLVVIGWGLLWWLPEAIWGKYRHNGSRG